MVRRLFSVGLFLFGILLVFRGLVMLLGMTTSPALALAPVETEPFVDTACLDCHTDKNRLTELTDVPEAEEEEAESLSSGPG